ncbi:MAG: glycosyltransferase family 39 protein [Deinococcus sp.]|nr:glycosyltransferase family 39 protein [Deinococcus sp.]
MTRAAARRSKLVRHPAAHTPAPPAPQAVPSTPIARAAAPEVTGSRDSQARAGGGTALTWAAQHLSWLTLARQLVLPGILVLALVLRLVYLFTVAPPFIGPDSRTYDQLAKHLLYNQVFSYSGLRYGSSPSVNVTEISDPESTTYYMPGYPLFLASLYALARPYPQSPFRLVRVVQAVLAVGAVYLVYLLARQLGYQTAGLVAAAIAALYPPFITSPANIMTEPLTLPVLLLAVHLTLRSLDQPTWHRILWAGILWGAVAMIRITFLPIPFFLGGALLGSRMLSHRAWARFLGIFTAGMLILVGPWVLRNLVVFGRLELTSGAGPVLNAASHYRFEDWILERSERRGAPADEAQGGRVGIERGLSNLSESLGENPLRFWHWLLIQKFSTLWGYWHLGEYSPNFPWLSERWWTIIHRWVVWPGFIGLLLALSRGRHSLVLLAPLALVTVVHQLTLGAPRYALPVIPLLVVGASWLLVQLGQRVLQLVLPLGQRVLQLLARLGPRVLQLATARQQLWASPAGALLLVGAVLLIVLLRSPAAAWENQLARTAPALVALLQAVIQLATLASLAIGLALPPKGGVLALLIAALIDVGSLPDHLLPIPRLLLLPLALWALVDIVRSVNWRRLVPFTAIAALVMVLALAAWRALVDGPWLYPWVNALAPPWGNLLFFGLLPLLLATGLVVAAKFRPAGRALAALVLTLSSFGLAGGSGLVPERHGADLTVQPSTTLRRELELPAWAHGYPSYALQLHLGSDPPGAGSRLQVLIDGTPVAETTVRYLSWYTVPLDRAVIGDKARITVELVVSNIDLEVGTVPGQYGATRLLGRRQPASSLDTPQVGLAMQGRGLLGDVNLWLGEATRQ